MAAGRYASVSSQSDTEAADLAEERREIGEQPGAELNELTQICISRGVNPVLARQVAEHGSRSSVAHHAKTAARRRERSRP